MMGVMATPTAAAETVCTPDRDFEQWMRSEQRRVFLLCWRMLGDREEADAAAQDVFLKAWRSTNAEGSGVDEPARWLSRIAVNTCLDRLRSRRWQFWRKRASAETEDAVWREEAQPGPDAEDQIFAAQLRRRLASALETLSPRQRAVFTLRHYENKPLDEIAQILGLDTGSVKSHMFRATRKMREELRDLYQLGKMS